jgi:membrane associated rhomboid family serine protease
MVLFRNFHHFILTCLGILTLGSYVEKAIGFKRCFVLAITTGVIGILGNNVINKNATL